MKYLKTFENKNMTLSVAFGTDFVAEVERTLEKLESEGLVKSFSKTKGVDSFNYKIEFTSVEGAFLLGKSRPQMKF